MKVCLCLIMSFLGGALRFDFLSLDFIVVKLLLFGDLGGLSCPKLFVSFFFFVSLLLNPPPRFSVHGTRPLGRRNGEVWGKFGNPLLAS